MKIFLHFVPLRNRLHLEYQTNLKEFSYYCLNFETIESNLLVLGWTKISTKVEFLLSSSTVHKMFGSSKNDNISFTAKLGVQK